MLSTGDFNCDGYEDLAIGVPNAPADGFGSAGQVVVVYGGSAATGIVVPQASEVSRAQLIDESVAGGALLSPTCWVTGSPRVTSTGTARMGGPVLILR